LNKETADNEIRARLAANDSSALEMIWNHYSSDLLGYLVSISCSRPDAEDSLQEVFLTIVKKRQSVAKARLLKPYLFRMARNVAINRARRSIRMREKAKEISDWLVLVAGEEQENSESEQLASALAELAEKQRVIIMLKFYQKKTFREIAEILSISENTAGSRYRYGMEKLKASLREITA